jgi:rhodanese-related sulfurtransferase
VLSPKSARKADELGYTNVKVYHDGMPLWKKGKNPLYSTAKSLADFNERGIPYVLIDVRPESEVSGGVIPGAVAIDPSALPESKGDFPKQKKAPLIIYSSSEADAEKAFAAVRGWGYKNTSILEGGVASWTAAGNALAGEAREKITYVPKPRPGAITSGDFRIITETSPADTVILDVRGTDETSEGMIKGAVNIPLPELAARLGEVPKNKMIVAQCNTGAQAEMAWNLLREKGFKSSWLNAKILVDPDGTWEVPED